MLEEYGLEIKYIKGPDKEVEEALIRLLLFNSDIKEIEIISEQLAARYCVDKLDSDTFPLTYRTEINTNLKTNNWYKN